MINRIIIICLFLFCGFSSKSQLDEMEALLEDEMPDRIDYTTATFKATRIISAHSVERMNKHEFDFRVAHRFGKINSGWYDAFGLDMASTNFRLDYGLSDWLMLGVGRSTYKKTFDGFAKFTMLRQCTGKKNVPVSVSYVSGIYINSLKWINTERTNHFSSRLAYAHQLLIARKFNEKMSAQLTPTIIHRNMVENSTVPNDIYSFGIASRYKLSKRFALCVEWFPVLNNPTDASIDYYSSFSLGFDIETGGHVFQLHLTNSLAIVENGFVGETTGAWSKGDIHFGFNISRVFTSKW